MHERIRRRLREPPKPASADFERFRLSFFEDKDLPRNGLDTAVLRQVKGKERRDAERMLIRFLPDARGIIGLGALRSTRAEPQLRRLFMAERRAQRAAARPAATGPLYAAYLAKALWPIRRHPHYLARCHGFLAFRSPPASDEAAISLCVFRHPAAVRALITALDDPERLVRHHAAHCCWQCTACASRTTPQRNDGAHAVSDHVGGRGQARGRQARRARGHRRAAEIVAR